MRKLSSAASVVPLNPSASTDVLRQITDIMKGLQSSITQLYVEWNQQAYPVLSSLPQGVEEERWDLSSSICPRVNGLDGANVFTDNSATSVSDGGRFWDSVNARPYTLKEVCSNLYTQLTNDIDALRQEITLVSDTGLTAAQMGRIGDNIFDATQTSASDSLDGLCSSNLANLRQLAKDLYDETFWSLDGDGAANLTNYSLRDMVQALLVLHDGSWNSDIVLSHTSVGASIGATYRHYTMATNEVVDDTNEIIIGGTVFDPSAFYGAETSTDIYFEAALKYNANGATGGAVLKLYDMGTPLPGGLAEDPEAVAADDPPWAGQLVSTFTRDVDDIAGIGVESVELAAVASPGVGADEIYDSERYYQLRLYIDAATTPDPEDTVELHWAAIKAVPVP